MSERDAAGNRRLARYMDDPGSNPGAEETSVPHSDQYGDPVEDGERPVPAQVGEEDDDDRPPRVRADTDTGHAGPDQPMCDECDATDSTVDNWGARGVKGIDEDEELCRPCALEREGL